MSIVQAAGSLEFMLLLGPPEVFCLCPIYYNAVCVLHSDHYLHSRKPVNLISAVQIMQRVVATSINHICAYRTGGHLSVTHMQIIALGCGTNGANGCFCQYGFKYNHFPIVIKYF